MIYNNFYIWCEVGVQFYLFPSGYLAVPTFCVILIYAQIHITTLMRNLTFYST